jgi:Uma2 family endonuclease
VTISEPYEELVEGETLARRAPGMRHEQICGRLHQCVLASVANLTGTRLLPPRSCVEISRNTKVCPDLALITVPNGKLWLAAEIVNSEDHRTDTVIKKLLYEEIRLPRLWMIDPRYDNVEIYHATQYGMVLKHMLAGHELMTEKLLPEFQMDISELFANARRTT